MLPERVQRPSSGRSTTRGPLGGGGQEGEGHIPVAVSTGFVGKCPDPGDILFQGQVPLRHEGGVGLAHVAEVPGLVADASDGLLPRRVALHPSILGHGLPEGLAEALIGEGGADEVNLPLVQAQVDGQPRLVLAAPGAGHIGLGEGQAILRQGAVPDGLLLGQGPPAADRYDPLPPVDGGHEAV